MAKIKAVIFDIGGVVCQDLVTCDCDGNLKKVLTRETGASLKAADQAWYAFKDRWQTGQMTSHQFHQAVVKKLKAKVSARKLQQALTQAFKKNVALIPATVKIIKKLKKNGYKLAALSNTNSLHAGTHFKRKDYRFFKPITLSYREGCRKPGKKIFLLTVKKMKLKPAECVFIDDKLIHVKGARKAGLKALQFKGPKKLAADLNKLGLDLA
jgi:epoxide hydrolase-like predicted phosphatase